jgi:hypothetical protein
MITLTDGTKTVKLTKEQMETIEAALRDYREAAEDIGWGKDAREVNVILSQMQGLDYE